MTTLRNSGDTPVIEWLEFNVLCPKTKEIIGRGHRVSRGRLKVTITKGPASGDWFLARDSTAVISKMKAMLPALQNEEDPGYLSPGWNKTLH